VDDGDADKSGAQLAVVLTPAGAHELVHLFGMSQQLNHFVAGARTLVLAREGVQEEVVRCPVLCFGFHDVAHQAVVAPRHEG